MSNLITKYKHEDLYLTTNTNVKLKKKHSSNDVSLAASAILFRKLCRLFHLIFGRDGRGSKSGRRTIEHTGIVIPIPAALPLAQTNRLLVFILYGGGGFPYFIIYFGYRMSDSCAASLININKHIYPRF